MLYEAREDVKLDALLKDMDAELNEEKKENQQESSGNLPYKDYVMKN